MLRKQLVTQIIFIYFGRKIQAPVRIYFTGGRRDPSFAVGRGYIGVIQRIYINGQPVGMPGKAGGAVHHPVIKAGGIICLHGKRIVRSIGYDA